LLTQKEEISYQATSLVVGYYLPIGKWFLMDAPLRLFAKAGVSQLSSNASGSLVRLENDRFTPATLGGGIEWEFHSAGCCAATSLPILPRRTTQASPSPTGWAAKSR
jgi:hypothetical protein